MPGSVEYIDKDKTKPLMYGAKADDDPPETALKEGEKCPGFPFYANREYVHSFAHSALGHPLHCT
jgi:hypothetical protein